jgi:group I intron endonuclease
MIGIYKITSPTNRIYIGQSNDIEKRWKSYLKNSKVQVKLHRSFLKYGIENHIFEVVEECSIELLNERERCWQDFYNVLNGGLNCILTDTKNKKREYCNETRLKRSLDASNISEETRQKRRMSLTGKKHSKETIDKIKESKKNISIEIRKKIGLASKNLPKEIREIISLKKSRIILNIETGIFYYGIKEVPLNIKKSTLQKKLSGINKNNTSYIYV